MLYDPGFDQDPAGLKLLLEFGMVGEGPLPTADWAHALLHDRANHDADRFVEADDPRPEMPPMLPFDSDQRKGEDAFVMFGEGEPDPFEDLPDGGNPGDIPVNGRRDPATAVNVTIGDRPELPLDGPGSGGGDGEADAVQGVPHDLGPYNCNELAYFEHIADSNISSARNIIRSILTITDPFQEAQVFDAILDVFQRQYEEAGSNPLNPGISAWDAWLETRGPNSMLATRLAALGVAAFGEMALFSAFAALFESTLDKDRIDAEQAKKGCGRR